MTGSYLVEPPPRSRRRAVRSRRDDGEGLRQRAIVVTGRGGRALSVDGDAAAHGVTSRSHNQGERDLHDRPSLVLAPRGACSPRPVLCPFRHRGPRGPPPVRRRGSSRTRCKSRSRPRGSTPRDSRHRHAFMVLYAMHDALVKTDCRRAAGQSLADGRGRFRRTGSSTSFRAPQGRQVPQRRLDDGGRREVLLRALSRRVRQAPQGARGRHRGRRSHKVRFRLKKPWLDFMTFFATAATGALDLPKEIRGEGWRRLGFKKAPVGAGPYSSSRSSPGSSWSSRRTTRTGASRRHQDARPPRRPRRVDAGWRLKRGEVDIAYSITGALAQE